MARYRPAKPFDTPMHLLPCTGSETVLGVLRKKYPEPTDEGTILFFGSFTTYGGTERTVNGVLSVEDTATIETWYRPEFAASGRVALANDPARIYEIIGEPENIEMRNQFVKFKATRVKGGT